MPVRVIAGEFRGRRLETGDGLDVRPTADRVRETIFNMLAARGAFPCGAVLDLYAGSGAMGIEGLSRGAERAVFVDTSRASRDLITRNLGAIGATARARVVPGDALTEVARLAGERFGVVLADPPYARRVATALLGALDRDGLVEPGGWCVLEHAREESAPDRIGGLARVAQRRFGGTIVDVYSRDEKTVAPHPEGETK